MASLFISPGRLDNALLRNCFNRLQLCDLTCANIMGSAIIISIGGAASKRVMRLNIRARQGYFGLAALPKGAFADLVLARGLHWMDVILLLVLRLKHEWLVTQPSFIASGLHDRAFSNYWVAFEFNNLGKTIESVIAGTLTALEDFAGVLASVLTVGGVLLGANLGTHRSEAHIRFD